MTKAFVCGIIVALIARGVDLRSDDMRPPYKLLYRLGFTPWEEMATHPVADQISALFDREEEGRQGPHGQALDLGCGSGVWSVELALRGWDVTGVDVVSKALRRARERAGKAGVAPRFVEGDVTALRPADIGSGFKLLLDFGTTHGLDEAQVRAVGRGLSEMATDDATLLMLAAKPARRGPMPRGLSRNEIEAAFPGWTVADEEAADVSGAPMPLRRAEPRFYRLRRAVS